MTESNFLLTLRRWENAEFIDTLNGFISLGHVFFEEGSVAKCLNTSSALSSARIRLMHMICAML